jgi:hypothetical protein
MAETTPMGVVVEDAKTDVKSSAEVPGTRAMLEIAYNDFLDAKLLETVEPGKGISMETTFDTWLGMAVRMLRNHRQAEIRRDYEMGQIGRAEYEALEEVRKKLLVVYERAEPRSYGFDQYGVQYVPVAHREEYKAKIGPNEVLTPSHRDVKIKTGGANFNGILRP